MASQFFAISTVCYVIAAIFALFALKNIAAVAFPHNHEHHNHKKEPDTINNQQPQKKINTNLDSNAIDDISEEQNNTIIENLGDDED